MEPPLSPLRTFQSQKDSVLSKGQVVVALGLCVLVIGFLTFTFLLGTSGDGDLRRVHVGPHEVLVSVADSPLEREQGLSGRPSLPHDEGLLFIFGESDIHAFWMKDMLFSIDILWFDAEYKLIHTAESVSPATYPQTFHPNEAALYVLEVPAGYVKEKNIKIGDSLSF